MGPNGSGKSTLAQVLIGHPKYAVSGKITLNNEDITHLDITERARKGLFLSFQYPVEIPGLTIQHFLRTALNQIRIARKLLKLSILETKKLLGELVKKLKMSPEFLERYLNDGFSGGEKKRAEILQMLALDPQVAILDETDSGLDIDALKAVCDGINAFMTPQKTILLITHYKRILEYVKTDKVFILIDGKIVLEGDGSLVDKLEEKGYGWISEK
jgi:Fe-S cluster assembly ATP-binding protein